MRRCARCLMLEMADPSHMPLRFLPVAFGAATNDAIRGLGLVDRPQCFDLAGGLALQRTDADAILFVEPERQRKADGSSAVEDVIGEALGKARLDEGLSRSSRHDLTLHFVDMQGKRNLYILEEDAKSLSEQNVDMSGEHPNHLAAWRQFRHMTQEELAEAVGCSVASIGHWETGARKLTSKWLPAIAKALNTTPGYILDHDPNDLPTAILDIWASIPEADQPKAIEMLKVFARTGTKG